MSVEKQAIRQALREQRRRLAAAFVETASRAACERVRAFRPFRSCASVIAYVAHENEVSPASLLDQAHGHRRVFLPRDGSECGLILWRSGDPLVVGRGGVQQPLGAAALVIDTPALALVPVVAWDQQGTRLGRGGGFYDRLFARLTDGCVRVGLAYEFQEWPELPRDPWDVSLHYVITERRLVRCRGTVVGEAPLQKGGMQL